GIKMTGHDTGHDKGIFQKSEQEAPFELVMYRFINHSVEGSDKFHSPLSRPLIAGSIQIPVDLPGSPRHMGLDAQVDHNMGLAFDNLIQSTQLNCAEHLMRSITMKSEVVSSVASA